MTRYARGAKVQHARKTREYPRGESPKIFFARIDAIVNKLKLVGVKKSPEEILEITMDRLPPEFHVQKEMLYSTPNFTRRMVEQSICAAQGCTGTTS